MDFAPTDLLLMLCGAATSQAVTLSTLAVMHVWDRTRAKAKK